MSEKNISPLDRLILAATAGGAKLGWDMDPSKGKYPRLWRWLTEMDAGEEYVKEPGTLAVKATPEGWQVTLSDRTFGKSVDATSETLEGVFAALEAMIGSTNPVIRSWPGHKIELKKRPKKKEDKS